MTKSIFKNISLALASIVCFFIFFEAVLRIIYSLKENALFVEVWPLVENFHNYDPYLGWGNKPLTEKIFGKIDFHSRVKINSKGLRDVERAYEKPNNTYRILLLGDSTTVGMEVDREKTFGMVLEEMLNKSSKNSIRFEVINSGVRGYGTDQELIFLKREGYKYHSDLIIYTFSLTDLTDNITVYDAFKKQSKPYFIFSKDGKLRMMGKPVREKFEPENIEILNDPINGKTYTGRRFIEIEGYRQNVVVDATKKILRYFCAYHFIVMRIKNTALFKNLLIQNKILTDIDPEIIADGKSEADKFNDGLLLTKTLIKEMSESATKYKSDFIVFNFSNGTNRLWADDYKTEEKLKSFCEENNISFIPSYNEFLKRSNGRIIFCYKHDLHWNSNGHRLAAELIYSFLKKKKNI